TRDAALADEPLPLTPGGGLGGSPTLTEARDDYSTQATSGAGTGSVGLAGALAITVTSTDTHAALANGSTVVLQDGAADVDATPGALNVTATESAANTTHSEPIATAGKVGIGASVAWSIATHSTRAEIEDQAVVTGAKDVNVTATSSL